MTRCAENTMYINGTKINHRKTPVYIIKNKKQLRIIAGRKPRKNEIDIKNIPETTTTCILQQSKNTTILPLNPKAVLGKKGEKQDVAPLTKTQNTNLKKAEWKNRNTKEHERIKNILGNTAHMTTLDPRKLAEATKKNKNSSGITLTEGPIFANLNHIASKIGTSWERWEIASHLFYSWGGTRKEFIDTIKVFVPCAKEDEKLPELPKGEIGHQLPKGTIGHFLITSLTETFDDYANEVSQMHIAEKAMKGVMGENIDEGYTFDKQTQAPSWIVSHAYRYAVKHANKTMLTQVAAHPNCPKEILNKYRDSKNNDYKRMWYTNRTHTRKELETHPETHPELLQLHKEALDRTMRNKDKKAIEIEDALNAEQVTITFKDGTKLTGKLEFMNGNVYIQKTQILTYLIDTIIPA